MAEDYIEGEVIYPDELKDNEHKLQPDHLKNCYWRTRDGKVIAIPDMADSHLRNAALFLMGMGYQRTVAKPEKAVIYLTMFRMEWERRMIERDNGIKKFRTYAGQDESKSENYFGRLTEGKY